MVREAFSDVRERSVTVTAIATGCVCVSTRDKVYQL